MSLTIAWLIVIGTLLVGFGLMSSLGRSVERRRIWPGVVIALVGGGLLFAAFDRSPDPLAAYDVPLAFIEIVAIFWGP